jgi:hypothetical protein
VSGEIVFEKLINTLMSSAIEHAGAERGVLLLSSDMELRQEAEAITSGDSITIVEAANQRLLFRILSSTT